MYVGERLRRIARKYLLSGNSVRYRLESRSIKRATDYIGTCDTLLDVGAGSGELSRRLLAEGFCKHLIALEPWDVAYAQLCRNLADYPNKEVLQDSLLAIPRPDQSIDCVMANQVLEHIAEDEEAVTEMARVLKPGGYAIISVPCPPEIIPEPFHVRPGYTEEQLVSLFTARGFSLVFTEYYLTLPTLFRIIAAQELPLKGVYLPAGWADKDKHLSNEERAKARPYCILCLFQRR